MKCLSSVQTFLVPALWGKRFKMTFVHILDTLACHISFWPWAPMCHTVHCFKWSMVTSWLTSQNSFLTSQTLSIVEYKLHLMLWQWNFFFTLDGDILWTFTWSWDKMKQGSRWNIWETTCLLWDCWIYWLWNNQVQGPVTWCKLM